MMSFSLEKNLDVAKAGVQSKVSVSDYIQVPGSVVLLSNNILPVARLTGILPSVL